ncbi:unnamed protein product [Spodoptera littoralis]|uniref:BEN domain-containing protein n=1 Tax=Spodoptera littoralis TaxID=7109 RepID=A0A9P0N2K8_SPOLI|nr:unnamed protein product [Spodoptera littoralis]CAH1639233.1 unnamed protein product [Spodoptera littoralis]
MAAPVPAPSTASASPAALTPASSEESNKIEKHVETQDSTMNCANPTGEGSSSMVESPSRMVGGSSGKVEGPSRIVKGPSKVNKGSSRMVPKDNKKSKMNGANAPETDEICKSMKKIRLSRRRKTSSLSINDKKEIFCNFLETCVRALDMLCNSKARKESSSSEPQDDHGNKHVVNTEANRPRPSRRHRESDDEDAERSNDRNKRIRNLNLSNTNGNNNYFVQIVDSTPQEEWVGIGTGQTLLHRDKFVKLKWDSYSAATRSLLVAVFGKETLATHSLTGKKSPIYPDRPPKECLDPTKVNDIIVEVTNNFAVTEKSIKNIITTKCADECKMERMRIQKAENERN